MIYLEKKLNEVKANGDGILSISLAPNGVHDYTELFGKVDYLLEAGMNQLLIISYLPEVMKLSSLATAEQRSVIEGNADGCYTDVCFDNIAAIHARYPDLPLITTPMLGDMIAYGQRRFIKRAAAAGVSGWDTANYLAISDPTGCRRLTEAEGIGFIAAVSCNAVDMDNPEHMQIIDDTVRVSSGELFVVPAKPGTSSSLEGSAVRPIVDRVRAAQDEIGRRYPLIGIGGISSAEDAYQMVRVAGVDGVHFSSAYMKRLFAGQPAAEIKSWLREVKDAMHS